MALGGGMFSLKNKILPGAYMNFVSARNANASLSDRGICTMPMELDWGVEGKIFEVTNVDFRAKSLEMFGYRYTDKKLRMLRDLFAGATKAFLYRLNTGEKASNKFATAKYSGIRGNAIKISIKKNVDDQQKFDVKTILDAEVVGEQTVASSEELMENHFVTFKSGVALEETVSLPLIGGTNGVVNGQSHQKYLDKIESYSFNTMGVATTDEVVKKLYIAFSKRLRDEVGVKFQTVLYHAAADYLGIINVKNTVTDDENQAALVYWVTGKEAGCAVNRTIQNEIYNGEYAIKAEYKQIELEESIKNGEFVFHNVGNDVCVLMDINSKTSITEDENEVFKENQTIRVIDQIGNDIAVLFNKKYNGKISNTADGRVSFWSDIVKHHRELNRIEAIENFKDEDVTVLPGDAKKSVNVTDHITVVNAMSQLYMTVVVS